LRSLLGRGREHHRGRRQAPTAALPGQGLDAGYVVVKLVAQVILGALALYVLLIVALTAF
jgi:hypothetical protein